MRYLDTSRTLRMMVTLITIWFPVFHTLQHAQPSADESPSAPGFVAASAAGHCADDHSSECPFCHFLMGGPAHLAAGTGYYSDGPVDQAFSSEAFVPGHHPFEVSQPRAPPFPAAPLV
jgi:hypothetical protein